MRPVLADATGDARLDIVAIDDASDEVLVYAGKGDGSFSTPVSFWQVPRSRIVDVGHMNADAWPDLVVVRASPPWDLGVSLADGSGGFGAPQQRLDVDGYPEDMTLCDFDRDGDLDVLVGSSQTARVYRNEGGGRLRADAAPAAAPGAMRLALADFDRDGWVDVVASGGTTFITVARNVDGETFAPQLISFEGAPFEVCALDLDANGYDDLVCVEVFVPGLHRLQTLLGREDGSFAPPMSTPLIYADSTTSLAALDANGDRYCDVAVAGSAVSTSPPVFSIYMGGPSGRLRRVQDHLGAHDSLVIGDVNADGRPDVVGRSKAGLTISLHR
jgi:hypothetical protein